MALVSRPELDEIRRIVSDCKFPGYDLVIKSEKVQTGKRDKHYHPEVMHIAFLQIQFLGRCVRTGLVEIQHGRKWYISPHMTRSEIIQTALAACLMTAEHEVREHFTWKGQPCYRPHFDVAALHDLSLHDTVERRKEVA
jgi:hypothetical protein